MRPSPSEEPVMKMRDMFLGYSNDTGWGKGLDYGGIRLALLMQCQSNLAEVCHQQFYLVTLQIVVQCWPPEQAGDAPSLHNFGLIPIQENVCPIFLRRPP